MTLPELWKQTRTLPSDSRVIVEQLFSELEHVGQKLNTDNHPNYEFSSANTSYYQPPWFNSNARIQ